MGDFYTPKLDMRLSLDEADDVMYVLEHALEYHALYRGLDRKRGQEILRRLKDAQEKVLSKDELMTRRRHNMLRRGADNGGGL